MLTDQTKQSTTPQYVQYLSLVVTLFILKNKTYFSKRTIFLNFFVYKNKTISDTGYTLCAIMVVVVVVVVVVMVVVVAVVVDWHFSKPD